MFKQALWILVILPVILITGCEFTTEPEMLSSEFMPLKVGNKWIYQIDSLMDLQITDERLVTQKKQLGEKEYFEVRRIINTIEGADTFYTYYRQWGNDLFVFYSNEEEGAEIHAVDFSMQLNDILQDGLWQRKVTEKDDTSLVIFSDIPGCADEEYYEKYVRGVGLVEYNNSWGHHIELKNYELK